MEKGITKSKRLKKEKTTGTKAKEGKRVKRAEGKGFYKGKGPTQKGFRNSHKKTWFKAN